MATTSCRCGHQAHGHYRNGTAARAGACRDQACSCRAFAPSVPEAAAPQDPKGARPMTPPRRGFPIHQ